MRGFVWVGESLLNLDKWQIKLLSDFFPIHIQTFNHIQSMQSYIIIIYAN